MKATLAACTCVLMAATTARAQSTPNRGYLSIGGTYQLTSANFSDVIHPIDFAERATVNTSYNVASMPGFDVGGGVRVWRQLSVGVNVARISKNGSGSVAAQVPHPFFFNRARDVSGNASGLHHEETSVHLQAVWTIPMTPRILLGISGGPSWINLRQDLVTDVTVTQTYPYDTATFGGVVPKKQTEGRAGFNAGTTVDYMFSRHFGADLTARYSHASIPLTSADNQTVKVDAGGGQVGGGIRIHF